jgi:hypothetical protein
MNAKAKLADDAVRGGNYQVQASDNNREIP